MCNFGADKVDIQSVSHVILGKPDTEMPATLHARRRFFTMSVTAKIAPIFI